MFSTQEYLDKKTGPYGIGRASYLQSLVTECQTIDSQEARIQVLGNLANFAYDPINFKYLRDLNVTGLFLDMLPENNEKIVEFAIGGLCNISLDKRSKEMILQSNGVVLISNCLSSSNEETVLSAITTLMNLVTPISKQEITSVTIVDAMLQFTKSSNKRLSNLAELFLQDYCTKQQIDEAKVAQESWEENG